MKSTEIFKKAVVSVVLDHPLAARLILVSAIIFSAWGAGRLAKKALVVPRPSAVCSVDCAQELSRGRTAAVFGAAALSAAAVGAGLLRVGKKAEQWDPDSAALQKFLDERSRLRPRR